MTTSEIHSETQSENPREVPSEVHSHDAATAPRGMRRFILPIVGYPGVIADNTTILANFFRRDLLGRFRGSFLGIFWVLIQPIFLFAIYFFVFGFLFAPRAAEPGTGPNVPFALYLFSGIIAFSSFSESTNRSCGTVIQNGNLVKKVAFPCELLPIPNIMVMVIVYLVGALVLLSVGFSTGNLTLSSDMLALPLVLLVHCVMSLGIGLILATLQVLIRDTSHLYAIFAQAWFFLSPVFWPTSMLEHKLGEHSWILELNPMYPLIQAHRRALGFGDSHAQMRHFNPEFDEAGNVIGAKVDSITGVLIPGEPLPDVWYHLGFASIWAAGFLLIGYSFFMSRKNKFADLV